MTDEVKVLLETIATADTLLRTWNSLKVLYDKAGLVAPDPSCVLRLDLDENQGNIAKDTSGQLNDGTIIGASWVVGKYGKALDFNGTSDYVDIPPVFSYPMTVVLWVKPADVSVRHQIYGSAGVGDGFGGENELNIAVRDNEVFNFYCKTEGTVHLNRNPGSYSIDEWHHIAVVLDSTYKFYVNGAEKDSYAINGTPDFSAYIDSYIGRPSSAIRFAKGAIDGVRVYNRALSVAEIKTQYEQGETKYLTKGITKPFVETLGIVDTIIKAVTLQPLIETATLTDSVIKGSLKALYDKVGIVAPDTSCVLRLDFDENRGTMVKDTSSLNNDGVIIGASWVDGKSGKALSFDGENDRVVVDKAIYNLVPKEITFLAWIYLDILPSEAGSTYEVMACTGGGWDIHIDTGDILYAQVNTEGIGWKRATYPTPLTAGEWYLVGGVYNGSNVVATVNSDFGTPNIVTGNLHPSTRDLFIGVHPNLSQPFEGIIDEVRIYNRALTAAQVKAHYEQGETKYLTKGISKPLTDALALVDTISKAVTLQPLIEAITLIDTYSKIWHTHQVLTDTLLLWDVIHGVEPGIPSVVLDMLRKTHDLALPIKKAILDSRKI